MSADIQALKSRRTVMFAINGVAALAAIAGIVGYFKFSLDWAFVVFVGALLVGFGAQIWFIAGLRSPKSSNVSSAGGTRAEKGV